MGLIILFSSSFIGALVAGYIGVVIQDGARKINESQIGSNVGKWLFLYPIYDRAETRIADFVETTPNLFNSFRNHTKDIKSSGESIIYLVITIIIFITVAGFVIFIGSLLISFILTRFFSIILYGFVAIILAGIAYYIVKNI